MRWKTVLQFSYIGLMVFGFWIAHAKAEVYVVVPPETQTPVSLSELPSAISPADIAPTITEIPEQTVTTLRAPASETKCPDIANFSDAAQIQQIKMQNGICAVTLAAKESDYPRRKMIWNSEGKFMSFVAQTKGQGAYAYYIMPISTGADGLKVDGLSQDSPDYEVKTSSEMIWSMDKHSKEFRLPSECQGSVTPVAQAKNGGVVLQTCKDRLVIDLGWSTKETPEMNSAGSATIRDPEGHSCKVAFTSFLDYKAKEDIIPKFLTADKWYLFLTNYPGCQNLNLGFLKGADHINPLQPPKLPTEVPTAQ